jgi:hypothetical protein
VLTREERLLRVSEERLDGVKEELDVVLEDALAQASALAEAAAESVMVEGLVREADAVCSEVHVGEGGKRVTLTVQDTLGVPLPLELMDELPETTKDRELDSVALSDKDTVVQREVEIVGELSALIEGEVEAQDDTREEADTL